MSRKLRIVHCFRSPVGGIFRHVRDLADAQLAAGHDVGIVCDSTTGGEYEERLFAEIEKKLTLGVRRTPMQRHVGPGDVSAAWRTWRILSDLKPDILHGHGAKGGAYARAIQRLMADAVVIQQPCQVFVALAEEGWAETPATLATAASISTRPEGSGISSLSDGSRKPVASSA